MKPGRLHDRSDHGVHSARWYCNHYRVPADISMARTTTACPSYIRTHEVASILRLKVQLRGSSGSSDGVGCNKTSFSASLSACLPATLPSRSISRTVPGGKTLLSAEGDDISAQQVERERWLRYNTLPRGRMEIYSTKGAPASITEKCPGGCVGRDLMPAHRKQWVIHRPIHAFC